MRPSKKDKAFWIQTLKPKSKNLMKRESKLKKSAILSLRARWTVEPGLELDQHKINKKISMMNSDLLHKFDLKNEFNSN